MKKFFFFRGSTSNGIANSVSVPPTDKQVYWESPAESVLKNQCKRNIDNGSFPSQTSNSNSSLRRSRSLSSAAVFLADDGLVPQQTNCCSSDPPMSPSSANSAPHRCGRRAFTPDRPGSPGSLKSSGNSSSSNVSSQVLDRYIDVEQCSPPCEEERPRRARKHCSSKKSYGSAGHASGGLPPRVQPAARPTPHPINSIKNGATSYSFREVKGTQLFPSRDKVETRLDDESPRRLAKNVIEKLSESYAPPKACSTKEFDEVMLPMTMEEVYARSKMKRFGSKFDPPAHRCFHGDGYGDGDGDGDNSSAQKKKNGLLDAELRRRSKEAEDRVVLLSEELDQESFLPDGPLDDVPSLVRAMRKIMQDRINMAIETSSLVKYRISERDSAREEIRLIKEELDSRTRRLEKEKNDLQLVLEKELDRRSNDWSAKLEKYWAEEQRLRERIRELAEQNVSLQKQVSSFNDRETDRKSFITHSEEQVRHLSSRMEEMSKENQELKQISSELKEKHTAAKEDAVCIKTRLEEKEKECRDLRKSITRLSRTCTEQEKTIEGLRERFSQQNANQFLQQGKLSMSRLEMEQVRLTGIELELRKEVEARSHEVAALRHENINLLNRIKDGRTDVSSSTLKLDREMHARLTCLETQCVSMLSGSTQLCCKLLEFMKGKCPQLPTDDDGLDGQFLIECDINVQGFKRGLETITRSLQTLSSVLQEKPNPKPCRVATNASGETNPRVTKETLKSELKAEALLTALLMEKLYSKEMEVEQIQAELSAAVRSKDILRCEIQNAMDNLSCASHKLKDFELQLLKKDEHLYQLENKLQETIKELTILKGVLTKVSEERDLMWDEVKKYNETVMLQNSEINMLKKKIETQDEDILLKEGQITILKDTLGSKPFDLLSSSISTGGEFLLT